MNGKQRRLNAILENNRAMIVPMDHGLSDGPLKGLSNISQTIDEVTLGGASAIVLHKGIIKSLRHSPNAGIIMHASAGTSVQSDTNRKVLVGSVKESIKLGADAFSLHINVGGSIGEPEMIQKLGLIAEECDSWQIPLLAMMYARGQNVNNQLDPEKVALSARVGAELGADIVKTVYTGDIESFSQVVEGCPVPVVVAGGASKSIKELLQFVSDVMQAGAIGVTIGRNIFSHDNPQLVTRAIRSIVINDNSVEQALELIKKENPILIESVSSIGD